MEYPPASHMLSVTVVGKYEVSVKSIADTLALVVKCDKDLKLIGPAPADIAKVNDMYRYVMYVKDGDEAGLLMLRERIEARAKELKPAEQIIFDFI